MDNKVNLKIENLHKSFTKFNWKKFRNGNTHILKGVNFNVSSGSFHGFIGPNGAGKTTTIQAILGIINKDSGQILLNNAKISQSKLSKIIAYIPHEISFPPHLSGLEFILEMAKMLKIKSYTKKFDESKLNSNLILLDNKELIEIIESERLNKYIKYKEFERDIKLLDEDIKNLEFELSINQNKTKYYSKRIVEVKRKQNSIIKKSKIEKKKYNDKISSFKENISESKFKKKLISIIIELEHLDFKSNPEFSLRARVIEMFDSYGIKYAMNKNPNNYSSGMKKKILLIHALLGDAKIFILDEPAANLDPDARIDLFSTLSRLNSEGKTIFICSHILKELEGLVNEVTIINGGIVKFNGAISSDTDITNLYQKVVGKNYLEPKISASILPYKLQEISNNDTSNIEIKLKSLEERIILLEEENNLLEGIIEKIIK